MSRLLNTNGSTPLFLLWLCLLVLLPPHATGFAATLVHHWTLDETGTGAGAIIADSVGGKNGSVAGAGVTSVEGMVGRALHFDGTADAHVNIPNFSAANIKIMTITFWLNLDTGTMPPVTGAYKRLISAADQWEAAIQADGTVDNGKIGSNFYAAGTKEFFPLSSKPAPEGQWIHVAMTASLSSAGGTGAMQIYINGVLDVTDSTHADDDWSSGALRFAHRPGAAVNQHFQGLLDDIRIYSGILSPEEIGDMYRSALPGPVPVYPAALPDINGANVPLDVTLQWTYNDALDVQVDSYTIFMDTNRNLVADPEAGHPMLIDGTGNATGILPGGGSDPTAAYSYSGLRGDTVYYWRVVANVRKPNPMNPDVYDVAAVASGPVWSFSSVTSRPVVNAGHNVITWLEAGRTTVVGDATVTDATNDVDSIAWSVVEQPAASTVDIAPPDSVNPVIALDTAGKYVLKIRAQDLEGNAGEDTLEIMVYADSCQAAKNNPDGYTPLPYDFNGDCKQNMADFAMLALFWLQDNSLTENQTFSGRIRRVWEKAEITLTADRDYANPYVETVVWVDLTGPGFSKRCYGFWDGGRTYRVRVLATQPGRWQWASGSNQNDTGLNGKSGSFIAIEWSEEEKVANSCRRGMPKASANGRAFEYADGTPYFLLADTWWAIPTFRYPWYDDDIQRPIDASGGFKDFVQYRKNQGYNCFAMLAAFPNWANDGRPPEVRTPDGTILRAAWRQAGTQSAKDMHDEDGNRAFFFPGKVPGFENIFPDLDRINPAYFRNMDKKVDYLNAHGILPFIEVARRDIGQPWKKYHEWPGSYVRYIQYVWARYQANICLFSPIHLDAQAASIPPADWNAAANKVIDTYGHPPFGTLASPNSNPSSLVNFGHVDTARWLTFHQIGNRRTHNQYPLLTDIFRASPPVPGLHGEPYYDGMPDAESGSDLAALYCRSGMYGSVLSGGLAGHIYGAGNWDGGMWGGNVEAATQYHIWDALKWPSGDQMRHLGAFILSEGRRYQDLVPHVELLSPNQSGPASGYVGWAYCARTDDKELFLLYFEKDCPAATLSGLTPEATYTATWFDPRDGTWLAPVSLAAGADGTMTLGVFPDQTQQSATDWGLKLMRIAEGTQ